MRLSEAIRLGAMLKPQGFGDYFDGVGTCAWGAANEAMGLPASNATFDGEGEWSVADIHMQCPVHGCKSRCRRVARLMEHLNDHHRWTREQIADWVETIESAREQASERTSTEDFAVVPVGGTSHAPDTRA